MDRILLPGRSYGNQDVCQLGEWLYKILLPGKSYGNQDDTGVPEDLIQILLPGRLCGNQSGILELFKLYKRII